MESREFLVMLVVPVPVTIVLLLMLTLLKCVVSLLIHLLLPHFILSLLFLLSLLSCIISLLIHLVGAVAAAVAFRSDDVQDRSCFAAVVVKSVVAEFAFELHFV